MSTRRDYKDRVESNSRKWMVTFIQVIALGGIVWALIIPFFFTDKIHIDPDGNCVRKIEVKFSEDIEHPCDWKPNRRFEEVHVDFPKEG